MILRKLIILSRGSFTTEWFFSTSFNLSRLELTRLIKRFCSFWNITLNIKYILNQLPKEYVRWMIIKGKAFLDPRAQSLSEGSRGNTCF